MSTDAPKRRANDPNVLFVSDEENEVKVDRYEVLPEEVKACAKKRCPNCWGKGEYRIAHPVKYFQYADGSVAMEASIGDEDGVPRSIPGPPTLELCPCALKKFLKANHGKVDIDFGTNAGKMWWRVEAPSATPTVAVDLGNGGVAVINE